MIAYVLTEEPLDAGALRDALPSELRDGVEFIAAGSISSVKSLARSLLVRRRTPVALVIKGAPLAPELTEERRQNTEEMVASVAAGVPVKVLTVEDAELQSDSAAVEGLAEFLKRARERSLAMSGSAVNA
jgi:hypothetical protein